MTTRSDYLGNPVTVDCDVALASIDDFVSGFLGYETRAAAIIAAADANPGQCLANAYAGMIWMLLEAPDAADRASKYLARAQETKSKTSPREQGNVDFLAQWVANDIPGALNTADEIAGKFPHDLIVVKVHQYLNFNRGHAPEMLRIAEKVLPYNENVPHIHGMIAFAYEQCHLLDDAETAARRALDLKAKEPWAQHALAHVMLTQGRIDEGAAFLEGVRDTWTDLNSFMITHLWWHLALFYLSQGRDADALDAYDKHCWAADKDYSQDQIGAVSLLSQLELAGIDVGDRWKDIGNHLASRAADTTEPFLTMQYLYGLARAGRNEADTLMRAVAAHARSVQEYDRAAWQDVALPACSGLLAHARGDHENALRQLGIALPRMHEIGGSHAQRDLFEQIKLDAIIQAQHWTAAQQALEARRALDPDGVPVNRALAKVYKALNLPKQSALAAARAEHTRQAHRPT